MVVIPSGQRFKSGLWENGVKKVVEWSRKRSRLAIFSPARWFLFTFDHSKVIKKTGNRAVYDVKRYINSSSTVKTTPLYLTWTSQLHDWKSPLWEVNNQHYTSYKLLGDSKQASQLTLLPVLSIISLNESDSCVQNDRLRKFSRWIKTFF